MEDSRGLEYFNPQKYLRSRQRRSNWTIWQSVAPKRLQIHKNANYYSRTFESDWTLRESVQAKLRVICQTNTPEVRVSSGQAEKGDRCRAGAGSADMLYSECLNLPEKWRVKWG